MKDGIKRGAREREIKMMKDAQRSQGLPVKLICPLWIGPYFQQRINAT